MMLERELQSPASEKYPAADWTAGTHLLEWIDAYSNVNGSDRSCWLGKRKKLVCMSWVEGDSSDEGDDDDDDEGEEEEEDEEEEE
jgi:hypothetical protein